MRFLALLPILALMACNSTGTTTSAGGTTAGGATGGAGSETAGATGGATGAINGTGTASSSGSGSAAASSTGPSPIGLWLGGSAEVNATELALGGDQKVSDTCPPIDPSANPAGVAAFDGQGNLWVQYPSDTNPIYMWTASQLAQACASGVPTVTLTSDSFGQPDEGFSAIAFDSQGNLWCVDPGLHIVESGPAFLSNVIGFRASDLQASGSTEPAWGFQTPGMTTDNLLAPVSLAFDRGGDLWIGNSYSVIAYLPSTLAAAVVVDGGIPQNSVPADFQITNPDDVADLAVQNEDADSANFAYRYLAFDADGDIWVTIENTEDGGVNQIVEFSSAQLAALSSNDEPTPLAVLTAEVANSVVWGPLAFDSSGTLWAAVQGGTPDLYGFSKANLATGSHPDLAVTVPGGAAASLAFDPIPKDLPIQP